METLVATVLIVVVFMVASMVLNTLFTSSLSRNDQWVQQELLQLQYRYEHGQLQMPYHSEMGAWQLEVSQVDWRGKEKTIFSAQHTTSKKELVYEME